MSMDTLIRRFAAPMLLTAIAALSIAACGPSDDAVETADDTVVTQPEVEMPTVELATSAPMATDEMVVEDPMGEPVTVMTSTSDMFGDYLVDGDGNSLYMFMKDTANMSACTDECAETWPPVIGEATAGEGVDAMLLGTIARVDGAMQVAYNGHPLYWYAEDMAAGDTTGHGVGDMWYLVNAAGEQVEAQ